MRGISWSKIKKHDLSLVVAIRNKIVCLFSDRVITLEAELKQHGDINDVFSVINQTYLKEVFQDVRLVKLPHHQVVGRSVFTDVQRLPAVLHDLTISPKQFASIAISLSFGRVLLLPYSRRTLQLLPRIINRGHLVSINLDIFREGATFYSKKRSRLPLFYYLLSFFPVSAEHYYEFNFLKPPFLKIFSIGESENVGNQVKIDYNDSREREVLVRCNPLGPITYIQQSKRKASKIHQYASGIALQGLEHYEVLKPANTGAVDINKKKARIKAYVEACERYSSGVIPKDVVFQHSFSFQEMQNISRFIGYDPFKSSKPRLSNCKQYPSVFSQKLSLEQGRFVSQGASIFPADMIFYPFKKDSTNRFYYANSSGVASFYNPRQAIFNGFFELLERDSICLTWLCKIKLPIIDVAGIPSQFRNRIKQLEHFTGCKMYILDARLDKSTPCFISVCLNNKEAWPYFHIGAGTHPSKDVALEKAIQEIEAPAYYSQAYRQKNGVELTPQQVRNVRHHYSFYHNPKNRERIRFFTTGDSADYAKICDVSPDADLKNMPFIHVFNLTTEGFETRNVYTVKVLTDELVPIWFGNKSVPLEHHRIEYIKGKFPHLIDKTAPRDNLFLHPMG